MPLVIDHKNISADALGLRTFGQVLAHLQRENRLVVHVLIDGEEPDLERIAALRSASTDSHTIFVETTEPQTMAREVLDEVEHQIVAAEMLGKDAGALMQSGQQVKAMENLAGCFKRWQHVQESVLKVSQLLRLDLGRLALGDGRPLTAFFEAFSQQLRTIRDALESRDFVALADVLNYEMPESTQSWREAVAAVRNVVDS